MFTICPKCALTLAVTAADLRVGQGYVRCGRCSSVFNALASLRDDPASSPPARAPAATEADEVAGTPAPSSTGEARAADTELEFDPSRSDVSKLFRSIDDAQQIGTGTFETIVLQGDAISQTEEVVPEEELDEELRELVSRIDPDVIGLEATPEEPPAAPAGTAPALATTATAPATATATAARAAGTPGIPGATSGANAASIAGTVSSTPRPPAPSPGIEAAPAAERAPPPAPTRAAAPAAPPPKSPPSANPAPPPVAAPDIGQIAEDEGASPQIASIVVAAVAAAQQPPATALQESAESPPAESFARSLASVAAAPLPLGLHPLGASIGSALLALLLIAQIVHHYRAELVAHGWFAAPLNGIYARLGAPITPAWDIAAYEIRQLGAAAPTTPGGPLVIRASVKNDGARAQPVPVIQLTLQDRYGNRLASRALEPREYLAEGSRRTELAAGERIDTEIEVADPGQSAVGFEIDTCLHGPNGTLRCAAEHPTRP